MMIAKSRPGSACHQCLAPAVLDALRERLAAAGAMSTRGQSKLLARELDWEDEDSLWALLMWNSPVAPELVSRITRWLDKDVTTTH